VGCGAALGVGEGPAVGLGLATATDADGDEAGEFAAVGPADPQAVMSTAIATRPFSLLTQEA
jgi:hypothetical protein